MLSTLSGAMMQTLESLRHRIDSAGDMQSVVAAMKVLAIVSIRQFERALESLSFYNRAIELGLQAALQERPRDVFIKDKAPAAEHICALVFGSEQGLSGQFNEQIVEYTGDQLQQQGYDADQVTFLAMGEHVVYRLAAAGLEVAETFSIPGSFAAVTQARRNIFLRIDELRRSGRADALLLFYHKPLTGASYNPYHRLLYPLDIDYLHDLENREWHSRSSPVFSMEWRELFSSLVRQYLAAGLETAFTESLLSENASRLLAMQVAEKNISEYLDDLGRQFNSQRQGQITAELLDIVAGSEAIHEEEDEYLALM
jgi:F-type H+-transporting ATPase subunit gamma